MNYLTLRAGPVSSIATFTSASSTINVRSHGCCSLATSHLDPHRAHQLQRVALGDDAGAHAVVEHHCAVFEVVFEVDVGGAGREVVGDLREGEVVRRGQADGAAADQAADDGVGADAAVVRVGAAEDFVEEEEERRAACAGCRGCAGSRRRSARRLPTASR